MHSLAIPSCPFSLSDGPLGEGIFIDETVCGVAYETGDRRNVINPSVNEGVDRKGHLRSIRDYTQRSVRDTGWVYVLVLSVQIYL